MTMARIFSGCITVILIMAVHAVATTASAQNAPGKSGYPNRTIRILLPFPPGGGSDIMARKFAQKMSERWGQQVVVDNRPGAGGKRVFGPGDVLFAEDRTGEGHANRELLGPRQSLIIPVSDDFDIRRWATAGK